MKTLELELKKKVFIVDTTAPIEAIEIDDYEFLCKGSELTEEMASELAFDGFNISENKKVYVDHYDECNCFESAIKSVISYVRIEGFHWLENPIKHPRDYELWAKYGDYTQYGKVLTEKCLKWQEAEVKTFKNPLIFVKK